MAWVEERWDDIINDLSHDDFAGLEGHKLRVFAQDNYYQIFDLERMMIYNICRDPYIRIDCNIKAALNVLGVTTIANSKVGRPKVTLDPYEIKRINEMRADGASINYIARFLRRSNRVIMRYLASVAPPQTRQKS